MDENGFLNPEGTLADRYVLMMGASHTQGKEVSPEQREVIDKMVDILEDDDDVQNVYTNMRPAENAE